MSKDRQQRREQQASVTSGQAVRDVTQAGPAPTVSDEVRQCERPGCEVLGRQSVKEGVWLCVTHSSSTPAETAPVFVRRGDFAGPPRNITINVTANGAEDPEQLSQAILRQVQAQLLMTQDRPTKPPANIPKALHHLRRAANALSGDAFQGFVLDCARGLIGEDIRGYTQEDRAIMETIASALDLDHTAKGAAKDVRAAIEALR